MMSDLEHCLAILKALQIVEVSYCLSGGGDSGTVELDHVLYADGNSGPLPTVTLGITDAGGIVCLDERLETIVYDLPDFDWINNEGGHGTVILRPQETDPDCQVECDMTYGEDSDEPDFEDDDEFSPPISMTPTRRAGHPLPSTTAPSNPRKETANDHLRLEHRHCRMLHPPRRTWKSPAARQRTILPWRPSPFP